MAQALVFLQQPTFTASIPVFGFVNSGGVLSFGVAGSTTLAILGVQVLEAVETIGLTIMMSKSIDKYGGYEVKHNYSNDHYPPHVHIYGDDIHKGSHEIRIVLDGNLLKWEPPLPLGARKAIKKLMDAIAKALLPWIG